MTLDDYFQSLESFLAALDVVYARQVSYDKRSSDTGFISGELFFVDGSQLHFREFVEATQQVERYKYSYHYQRSDGALVFRYDRTPHFPALPNFPHHKHVGAETNVVSAKEPDLIRVVGEIRKLLLSQ